MRPDSIRRFIVTGIGRRVILKWFAALLLAFPGDLCASALLFQVGTDRGSLRLSSHSRALVEGEAVMLRLQSPSFRSASVRFNGQDHAFLAPDGPKEAFTLIPLGLDIDAGKHELRLDVTFADGSGLRERLDLPVRRATFASTVLRVDPRFTAPSAKERVRVEKERALVARIYNRPQPGWLAAGDFIRPLAGGVSSSFGVLRLFNDVLHSRHRGVDLRAPQGAPVRAANAGRVVLTRSLFFAGDTVIIDHGLELFTIYCHLSETTVGEGEMVEKGALLGRVGATGRATGPHLHWGARLAGTHVDPLSILQLPFE
jgi:murein DD-endopeptidase MepM/ murein hydrolase activator NlpD